MLIEVSEQELAVIRGVLSRCEKKKEEGEKVEMVWSAKVDLERTLGMLEEQFDHFSDCLVYRFKKRELEFEKKVALKFYDLEGMNLPIKYQGQNYKYRLIITEGFKDRLSLLSGEHQRKLNSRIKMFSDLRWSFLKTFPILPIHKKVDCRRLSAK